MGRRSGAIPLAILALAVLVGGCGPAPSSRPTPTLVAAPATPERVPRRWLVIRTAQLVIGVDRATGTLLIRPAAGPGDTDASIAEADGPGDAAGGVALREERWASGPPFRGAPLATAGSMPVTSVRDGDEVRLLVGPVRSREGDTSDWVVSTRGATVRVDRSIPAGSPARDAQSALVMELPPPIGALGRLAVVEGTAFLPREGLSQQRGRADGATVGAVDLDLNGLAFSARSAGVASAAAATTDGITRLALVVPFGSGGRGAEASATLQFGAPTGLQSARSAFSPGTDARLLATGYYGNVIDSTCCGRLLRASMVSYQTTVWVRDLAYAARGYGHVLEDLGPLRNSVQAFLDRTDGLGTVPEFITLDGEGVRRGAWDSQPDLIHAAYAYIAQSGDRAFAERNLAALRRVATWLRASDTDGDGLPDRTDAPYGYFDSVANGVRHTYAIASFYRAYRELAELEDFVGRDGAVYREAASRLQAAFNRPVAEGGFWPPDRPYPVAWFAAGGAAVAGFETFGIFAAIESGLIPPGLRLDGLLRYIHAHREEFIDGAPFGERLMLGGYDPHLRREVNPAIEPWMLDASAPWIAGLGVPVRARAGYVEDANIVLAHYLAAYGAGGPPMPEFAAGHVARYGAGRTPDAGRSWDSAAWFAIVYGGHYGLHPTPGALRIEPAPLRDVPGDRVSGYRYGDARVTLALAGDGYSVSADRPCTLTLLPPTGAATLSLDGGAAAPSVTVRAEPGRVYAVRAAP